MPLPAELPFPNIDPVIIQFGPLGIHWYGLGYVVGILFGWWYARRLVSDSRLWPNGQSPIKATDIDDLLVWVALGIVLGGRIGYILFYDLPRYLSNPLDIFAVWQGGMSFHGGFLGVLLAMIVFSIKRGLPARSLFDVIAPSATVGIGLVRCTNFINSELWGRPTDVPWAIVFPNGGPFARHPSQLYETLLEGLALFLLLRFLTHSRLKLATPGFVAGAFVAGYGCARIFVEFFREPDAQIGYLAGGWLTMGMVLSAPLVIVGVILMATARRAAHTKPA